MPLYEFYCPPCHTIFTFRSLRTRSGESPLCPRCGGRLKREVSPFSHSVRGRNDAGMNDEADTCDRMDRVIAEMGERMQALEDDEGDPREAVSVLRRMAEAGGVRFKPEVLEAMARIDAGEDPEKIDALFGEVLESENPFDEAEGEGAAAGARWWRRLHEPAREFEWHDWPTE